MLLSSRPWFGFETDNLLTRRLILNFPDPLCKLRVVKGDWRNQEDARNDGLGIARAAGFPYAMIVDADEVYEAGVLDRMMAHALASPTVDCWHMYWLTYWKSPAYRIDPPESYVPPVFVRTDGPKFTDFRNVAGGEHSLIPSELGYCHHLSYARSDADVLRKISSFGHASAVIPGWFENIWKRWDVDHTLENLHPTNPPQYKRAVPSKLTLLPKRIRDRLPPE